MLQEIINFVNSLYQEVDFFFKVFLFYTTITVKRYLKKKLLQFWTASNPEWDTALGVTVPVAARVTGVIYDPDGTRRPFDHWYELIHYRQTVHGASVFEVIHHF